MDGVINTGWHPLANGSPPDWATGWGQDEHGVFVEFTVRDVTAAMRWIPRGRFMMGSPEEEEGRFENEGPLTEVTFREGFWLGETAVTQALYHAVMSEQPSRFKGEERPVDSVSWEDAKQFMDQLNGEILGLNMRLPSEAEWEYACRAGSDTPFEPTIAVTHTGASVTTDEVNFDGNNPFLPPGKGEWRQETVAARGKPFRSNKLGLWHMHGNLWEWCGDSWSSTHEGAAFDGALRRASESGLRVLRGGSWNYSVRHCRAACRSKLSPAVRNRNIGFRLARGQARALASI